MSAKRKNEWVVPDDDFEISLAPPVTRDREVVVLEQAVDAVWVPIDKIDDLIEALNGFKAVHHGLD